MKPTKEGFWWAEITGPAFVKYVHEDEFGLFIINALDEEVRLTALGEHWKWIRPVLTPSQCDEIEKTAEKVIEFVESKKWLIFDKVTDSLKKVLEMLRTV